MSSSPPDLSTLSLQRLHDPYEYDRAQFPYATTQGYNLHPALKSKPLRSGLPSQWIESNPSDPRPLSPHNNSDFSSAGGSPPLVHVNPPVGSPQPPSAVPPQQSDDEIIPTAIVIKNIPFNVKRDTLLDIIASLSIPTPYAFNYHLDQQGSFRGLAFANFRHAADADAVVVALNGFDVQGRKLRVEYKKVLQAGEKERIEREKALRRMRSMQLEKEQHQHQNAVNQLYEDYGTVLSSAFSPQRSFSSSSYQQQQQPSYSPPGLATIPTPSYSIPLATTVSTPSLPQPPGTPSISEKSVPNSNELDLNDPSTLEIYSRILLFKDDKMRDELAFSRTLSAKQRRVVHLIAQKLGVYHFSVGDGDDRYAVVTKIDPHRPQPQPQRQPHTLSRAPSAYLSPISPTTTANTLRVKKSMPDMKTLHQQAPRLTSRASNGNIREGYATIASSSRRVSTGFGSLFSGNSFGAVPPVPNLPSAIGSLNGTGTTGTENGSVSAGVVRQPRGPGIAGFNRRDSRVVASESQVRVRTDSLTCNDGRSGNGI